MNKCKCYDNGYSDGMVYEELRAFVNREDYCTSRKSKGYTWSAVSFLCPTVAKALRKAEVTRDYQERRRKQLKRDGHSEEQIAEKLATSKRGKRGAQTIEAPVVEFDFEELESPKKKRPRVRVNA